MNGFTSKPSLNWKNTSKSRFKRILIQNHIRPRKANLELRSVQEQRSGEFAFVHFDRIDL